MRALRDVSYLVAECLICFATGFEIVLRKRPTSLASLYDLCQGNFKVVSLKMRARLKNHGRKRTHQRRRNTMPLNTYGSAAGAIFLQQWISPTRVGNASYFSLLRYDGCCWFYWFYWFFWYGTILSLPNLLFYEGFLISQHFFWKGSSFLHFGLPIADLSNIFCVVW